MPWAEGGNADSDKKPGVVSVQVALCHHVVRDVARLPTLIKFSADLTTGDDRALPGREGDAPGGERAQEIAAVDRVGMRGRAATPTTLSSATSRTRPANSDRRGLGECTWGVATAAAASVNREVIAVSNLDE